MTAFISLEVGAGQAWLNVAHIVSVVPAGDCLCEVTSLTGAKLRVRESANEVVDKLRNAVILDA